MNIVSYIIITIVGMVAAACWGCHIGCEIGIREANKVFIEELKKLKELDK